MAYPFPNIQYRTYPYTFLQRVQVQIDLVVNRDLSNDSLVNACHDIWGIDVTGKESQFYSIENLRIISDTRKVKIQLSNRLSLIEVDVDEYSSFVDSIWHYISDMLRFLEKIDAEINGIHLRKINVWPFKFGENKPSEDEIFRSVFSVSMLNEEFQTSIDGVHSIKYADDSTQMNIKYCFIEADKDGDYSRVILDTACTCIMDSYVKPATLEQETFGRLNQNLFCAYHWCVSSAIVKIMEEG